MGLRRVDSGSALPNYFNVIIEIPMNSGPVKYEVDKDTGTLAVDRFMATPMFYPANYGFIPQTLSLDGDPVDVLVLTPVPVISGSVIQCRAIGVLKMTDESGEDAKILALPIKKLTKVYDDIETYKDLPLPVTSSIEHFFKHYKDLEDGKWVKIDGWDDVEAAHAEIMESAQRYI